MDKNYGFISNNYISNAFTLRRSGVANFSDIIKNVTIFIKPTFKDPKKLKELEIMH